jgi:hypothetical protein
MVPRRSCLFLLLCMGRVQEAATTYDYSKAALVSFKATVGGGSDPAFSSWNESDHSASRAPCGTGWDRRTAGWNNVKCDAMGGGLVSLDLAHQSARSGAVVALAKELSRTVPTFGRLNLYTCVRAVSHYPAT